MGKDGGPPELAAAGPPGPPNRHRRVRVSDFHGEAPAAGGRGGAEVAGAVVVRAANSRRARAASGVAPWSSLSWKSARSTRATSFSPR